MNYPQNTKSAVFKIKREITSQGMPKGSIANNKKSLLLPIVLHETQTRFNHPSGLLHK